MKDTLGNINSPLFDGIASGNLTVMLGCIGYRLRTYKKGEIISLEDEHLKHVGIILSGTVDMIKEDSWGNKTTLVRMRKDELFGESFACGSDTLSFVSFAASEDSRVLFLPFNKVMHTCTSACAFHHRLIENMVHIIADKNRDLMRKLEVISKKSLREKVLTYLSLQSQLHSSHYFEIPLGRVELAEYLCADRSALTRELVKMRDEGLIDYDKNCFRIL